MSARLDFALHAGLVFCLAAAVVIRWAYVGG